MIMMIIHVNNIIYIYTYTYIYIYIYSYLSIYLSLSLSIYIYMYIYIYIYIYIYVGTTRATSPGRAWSPSSARCPRAPSSQARLPAGSQMVNDM